MSAGVRIGIVVIGRNEGERLRACLSSLPRDVPVVYVDSGSTDDSVALARAQPVTVIELDSRSRFTAARARNAGLAWMAAQAEPPDYVQMVDGDCTIAPEWLARGAAALADNPGLVAVFGRLRERFPDRSLFNRLCDDEWNVPVGPADACGGNVLWRLVPVVAARGYAEDLIAGEEPDLCLRLRKAGWSVIRIDAEMGTHDAAMTRAGQWWSRARRAGYAFADHVWRHRGDAIPNWRRQCASILVWGLILPAAIVLGVVAWCSGVIPGVVPAALLAVYPLQLVRMARRKRAAGADPSFAAAYALFMMASKFAGLTGMAAFLFRTLTQSAPSLIEYRKAA
jgi:glycosyltransferase involved in cell wall biosynthesis